MCEHVCVPLSRWISSFYLIASSECTRRAEDHRCSWTRAVKYACTPLCFFHLRGTKNCNNFFGRGSPRHQYVHDGAVTSGQLRSLSFVREKKGSSWQEASFVIVYLFCPGCVHIWQLVGNKRRRSGLVTLAARVMLRSFITSSNAAVSSACFWLCKAIFSLNFRGLFEVAMFRSSAPFFPSVASVKWRRVKDTRLPVGEADTLKRLTVSLFKVVWTLN